MNAKRGKKSMGTFLLLSLVYMCWTTHKIYKKVYNKKNKLERIITGAIEKHAEQRTDNNSDNDSDICNLSD